MKTVLSKSEIPHIWAHQLQSEARTPNNSFYFYNETIYSYGGHFPIAVHYHGMVLFTLRTYSVTTASHLRLVRGAISHKKVIYCKNPKEAAQDVHTENIAYWFNQIEAQFQLLTSARKPQKYLDVINTQVWQLNEYMGLFPKIKLTGDQKKILNIVKNNNENIVDAVKSIEIVKETERKNKERKYKSAYATYLAAWRKGEESNLSAAIKTNARLYGSPDTTTLIRFLANKNVINTSKGVDVPVNIAKRFYDKYLKVCKKGGCEGNCGEWNILGYNVTSATNDMLVVGCHRIPRTEIDMLVKTMKW